MPPPGGYLGARLALLLHPSHIRVGISAVNFAITPLFCYRGYFKPA